MRNILAVEIVNDPSQVFYYNPKLITNYKEAVQYQINNDKSTLDLYTEYLLFPEGYDLDQIVLDILESEDLLESEYDWLDLAEVQKHFNINTPVYADGEVVSVGDRVLVNSDDFSWGLLASDVIEGYVSSIDHHYYTQVMLDGFKREVVLPNYKVTKNEKII